jgi:hypothetical protein
MWSCIKVHLAVLKHTTFVARMSEATCGMAAPAYRFAHAGYGPEVRRFK